MHPTGADVFGHQGPSPSHWACKGQETGGGSQEEILLAEPQRVQRLAEQVRKSCLVCQACESGHPSNKAQVQWTPIPSGVMERVALDVFSLPETKFEGKLFDCVVLCVDSHIGWMLAMRAR